MFQLHLARKFDQCVECIHGIIIEQIFYMSSKAFPATMLTAQCNICFFFSIYSVLHADHLQFSINTICTQNFHLLVNLDLYTSERLRRYVMKKPFIAVLIALLFIACVGASMFAIGEAA